MHNMHKVVRCLMRKYIYNYNYIVKNVQYGIVQLVVHTVLFNFSCRIDCIYYNYIIRYIEYVKKILYIGDTERKNK